MARLFEISRNIIFPDKQFHRQVTNSTYRPVFQLIVTEMVAQLSLSMDPKKYSIAFGVLCFFKNQFLFCLVLIFLILLNCFDILMLKINFKNKKIYIILMHFQVKNILIIS
jgi:hypothetical protein